MSSNTPHFSDLYAPLFDTEAGGSAKAFMCRVTDCGAVTKTCLGMLQHLERKHQIKIQLEIENVTDNSRTDVEQPIHHKERFVWNEKNGPNANGSASPIFTGQISGSLPALRSDTAKD